MFPCEGVAPLITPFPQAVMGRKLTKGKLHQDTAGKWLPGPSKLLWSQKMSLHYVPHYTQPNTNPLPWHRGLEKAAAITYLTLATTTPSPLYTFRVHANLCALEPLIPSARNGAVPLLCPKSYYQVPAQNPSLPWCCPRTSGWNSFLPPSFPSHSQPECQRLGLISETLGSLSSPSALPRLGTPGG